ncbi:MAG: hypothetical protein P8J33_18165, partial [Pirellulaceae bacterium]|nr:hypothetical protein [Pirellulaceae bacterium]
MHRWILFVLVMGVSGCFVSGHVKAQETVEQNSETWRPDGKSGALPLTEFRPRTMLKNIRATDLAGAKYPAIDVHSHFGRRLRGSTEGLVDFVEVMDRQNIALCISLDAQLGVNLADHQKYLQPFQDRFAVFVHLDFQG